LEHAEADVLLDLAEPIGERLEVDLGSDLAHRLAGSEGLEHRAVDERRSVAHSDELVAGTRRRLVQRQEESGSVADCTRCDRGAKVDHLLDRRR
jgi:hypothetical protein